MGRMTDEALSPDRTTNEKAPIKGLKEYTVFQPGAVVYVKHDHQTVKRLVVGKVVIDAHGPQYLFGMSTYQPGNVFGSPEEAFKEERD